MSKHEHDTLIEKWDCIVCTPRREGDEPFAVLQKQNEPVESVYNTLDELTHDRPASKPSECQVVHYLPSDKKKCPRCNPADPPASEPPVQCRECDEMAHLCTVHGVGGSASKPCYESLTPKERDTMTYQQVYFYERGVGDGYRQGLTESQPPADPPASDGQSEWEVYGGWECGQYGVEKHGEDECGIAGCQAVIRQSDADRAVDGARRIFKIQQQIADRKLADAEARAKVDMNALVEFEKELTNQIIKCNKSNTRYRTLVEGVRFRLDALKEPEHILSSIRQLLDREVKERK